nr:ketoacyl-ACP synthase III [uncultured Bacteroides sp.]
MKMYINSIGYYIPSKRIDNDYFAQKSGVTNKWINQRTEIQSRSRALKSETMNFMCSCAVKQGLSQLPYNSGDIDLIIFASYTPTDTVATMGHIIQREFNLTKAKVFYISSACSSAINAIEIIQSFFQSDKAKKALLICGDRNSSFSDDKDRTTGHLWGDAAAAFFFSKERHSIHDAELVDIITQGLGHVGMGTTAVTLNIQKRKIEMPGGRDVFMHACNMIANNITEITVRNKCNISDINYFISHQANMRILKNVAHQLDIPNKKMLSNIEYLGNTGCVSSLLVFAENYTKFKPNDVICISVFGGGYSAGACLFKINNGLGLLNER